MHTKPAGAIAHSPIHRVPPPLPAEQPDIRIFGRTIPPAMTITGPADARPGDFLSRSEGVMTRARMVNTMLRHHGVDCTELDALTGSGSAQLAAVQAMNRSGRRLAAGSFLVQFHATVTRLRDTYREILVQVDIPGEIAQGVLSVAQSLDVTAVDVKTTEPAVTGAGSAGRQRAAGSQP